MFRWSRKTYKEAHRLARVLRNYGDAFWGEPAPVKHYMQLWEEYEAEHKVPFLDPFVTPLSKRLEFYKDPDAYIPF